MKTQYILDLEDEEFVSFVYFNTFDDIGFDYDDQNERRAVSSIVYITENKENQLIVNLLFVDVYEEKPTFKIYKSKEKFPYDFEKDMDIVLRTFLYST